jgi:hypothetical protein
MSVGHVRIILSALNATASDNILIDTDKPFNS